uniref:NADH dehydrogenase [ubiquinone] 1 beta subcomplex subunit 4 n=1 Tax=Rhinolophus ferrumequinum TaxID=59479 RepID=A0A671FEX2_RHIFE
MGYPFREKQRARGLREYDLPLETWKAQAEQSAIRSQLKRLDLLQYNDPNSQGLIKDPALTRWTYPRSANVHLNSKKLIQEGKLDQKDLTTHIKPGNDDYIYYCLNKSSITVFP